MTTDPTPVVPSGTLLGVTWEDMNAAYLRVIEEVATLRAALRDIVDVDPVDAALDPTRPLRIAEHALASVSSEGEGGPR